MERCANGANDSGDCGTGGSGRFDRKRKKKTSNKEWTHPHDPDAKVAKVKDGRTVAEIERIVI